MFANISVEFFLYFTSIKPLHNIYLISTNRISVPYRAISGTYSSISGTYYRIKASYSLDLTVFIYSQRGNVLFPGWEHFIPKVGIIVTLNGRFRVASTETMLHILSI